MQVVRAHWKGNEITGKAIANAIGLRQRSTGKEGADMRSVINACRKKGLPICANGKGYYWPRNRQEITEYIHSLEGRIRKEEEALNGMKTALDTWEQTPQLHKIDESSIVEI